LIKKGTVLLLIMLLVFGVGCSSKNDEGVMMEAPMESVEYKETADGFGSDDVKYGGLQTDRKVVQRAYIAMETRTFDKTVKAVKDKTYEYKGYFESMRIDGKRMDLSDDEQYRNSYFVIRIPKDKYENFLNAFEKLGNIVTNELKSEDVTDNYIDTEARLKTLKIQEERLLEILMAATEIEDIIVLEERLSEIRYDIEGYTGNIRKWDNLVEFTTIELRINEVQEVTDPKPDNLTTRSVETFVESTEAVGEILRGLVVLAFGLTPFLVIFVPVGFGIRYMRKRRKAKKELNPKVKKEKSKLKKEKKEE